MEFEAREGQFRKDLERYLGENRDLEAQIQTKQAEFKVKIEEIKRENNKLEDKVEQLTDQNKTLQDANLKCKVEISKKNEEIKQLKKKLISFETQDNKIS